jgi:hypothetical protein
MRRALLFIFFLRLLANSLRGAEPPRTAGEPSLTALRTA